MDFLKSTKLVARLDYLPETGSTNTDLVAEASAAPTDFPHLSVLVAGSQTAGKGRIGRVWQSPPGTSLAISVLIRTDGIPLQDLGWVPLLAGVAMRDAVAKFLPESDVGLKWPNDVQVGGKKISGILVELLPGAKSLVIGAGINLGQTAQELPIEAATSLAIEGSSVEPDDFLEAYLSQITNLLKNFNEIREAVRSSCNTIGRSVKAILPTGEIRAGQAVAIDDVGRLVIRETDGNLFVVAAGDIEHLRQN